MKKILIASLIAICAQTSTAAECNRAAALEVQAMMRELVTSKIEGDHLAVYWIDMIESQPESKRLALITTYADMDACLTGRAREIHFYRKAKLVGIASPVSGIRLVH